MTQDFDPRRSSIAVGAKEPKKRRGLLWLVLALAALIILIVLLVSSCGSDDDSDSAATSTPAASAPAATTPPEPEPAASTPATPAATDAGTLTAADQSLLGGDAAAIGDQAGEDATGTGVKVLSLSEGGFFVGTDATDRQYVEFGGRVGGDEADSELPAVGDTVDLSGPVRPAPKSAGTTLKLSDADAQTVAERGSYINADSVAPSAG